MFRSKKFEKKNNKKEMRKFFTKKNQCSYEKNEL